jgi:hypothetical protein
LAHAKQKEEEINKIAVWQYKLVAFSKHLINKMKHSMSRASFPCHEISTAAQRKNDLHTYTSLKKL